MLSGVIAGRIDRLRQLCVPEGTLLRTLFLEFLELWRCGYNCGELNMCLELIKNRDRVYHKACKALSHLRHTVNGHKTRDLSVTFDLLKIKKKLGSKINGGLAMGQTSISAVIKTRTSLCCAH